MKKSYNIGIMQGRLTKPKGRGIQFFPFDNWENEFYVARDLGIDEIEFIFDYDNFESNPLWTEAGIKKIDDLMEETGVKVKSVCFDYFMRRAFFKQSDKDRVLAENTRIIEKVLSSMSTLKIELIEIPLVDDSSLKSDVEKREFREFLNYIVKNAPNNIRFGLETDLPPREFKEYLDSFENLKIGANYDSGNSSGLGYDHYEEVTTLNDYIFNIHIKDRVYKGTTVALGTGSANFEQLFRGLKEISYKGSFILQAARSDEGKENDNIKQQKLFLKQYVNELSV